MRPVFLHSPAHLVSIEFHCNLQFGCAIGIRLGFDVGRLNEYLLLES